MHVLLITQYFHPEIGAAASRWGDYTKILINQGHKVTVLCEVPNYQKGVFFQLLFHAHLLMNRLNQGMRSGFLMSIQKLF